MEILFDFVVYFVLAGFAAWVVAPTVIDLLGYNWKKDLDVYDSYCNLSLMRRYGKNH